MAADYFEIHTSDRQLFKRCRRKYGWASTLRDNLVREAPDKPAFFLGTGVHFALEDFHGYRRFAHPALAFAAYVDAQKADNLPDEIDELTDLAAGMLMYYADDWLAEHPEPYETLVVDGKPQVEVEVAVDITGIIWDELERRQAEYQHGARDIGWLSEVLGGKSIHYVTTYDRVVLAPHDIILGLDYKTAAQFDELNLQSNPQAGSYDWSLNLFYGPAGFKVGGIVWQQHKKAVPASPKVVNVGKKNEGISLNGTQPTTYRLYKRALQAYYGKGVIPDKHVQFLNILADMQDDDGDQFIRRDTLRRNQTQREVEQGKIVAEVIEMLDPDLPLYPNPTKECSWDCPFKEPCLAMDDGSDYEFMLTSEFTQWAGYKDDWRRRLKYPDGRVDVVDEPTILIPAAV